ncbi:DNA polymerase I-like isoform X1 [Petromyzon marinus]|uniref:DNA polymerase I-like isoform X1 n=1 Tax=Petromyzon marinus TaxID=7757 RepID=UPI003F713B25
MGAASLANQLGVSTEEADNLIQTFMETYPGVRDFLRRTVDYCRRHGHVETITGRRRLLPDILSTDTGKRAQAERQAVNSVLQGSASDVMSPLPHHQAERQAVNSVCSA